MKRTLMLSIAIPLLLVALLVSGCTSSKPPTGNGGSDHTTGVTQTSVASDGGSTSPQLGGTASVQCPGLNTTGFAKTKFVLHAGVAFGAFHRYIYKPFRAGTFHSGARGRVSAFVKAALAALFIKREVRLAYGYVKADPMLCTLIAAPLQMVGDKISGAVSALKGGDTSSVTGIEQSVQAVKRNAASSGSSIVEDSNGPLALATE